MNGVHDMGGMHDMGKVSLEKNEPVFHEFWEGRVYALNRAAAAGGKWNLDASRYEIELIPPAEYLRMSYYERWHARLVELLIKRRMVTRAEILSGQPASGSPKATPVMKGEKILVMGPANPERATATIAARFAVGQQVRARNIHPTHHTRCRATHEENRASLCAITEFLSSPTQTLISKERILSTSTRSVSRQRNCGAAMLPAATLFIWIFGTNILNSPEALLPAPSDLVAMPQLPRDEKGPEFAEPWQAQAFALAVRLSAQGYFSWKEWASTLGLELADAAQCGEADNGSTYYERWLAALEKLVTAKGLADVATLFERKEAWADAYRHTPHGKPVQLRSDFRIDYKYRQAPLREVTRADGVCKQIRIQDGHLFVCNGCCCGRTEKGFPALPLDDFKRQWKQRGIRRRLHLTISGCLGPCPLANVILLEFHGRSLWFHSINQPEDVNAIYDYVERMLVAETILDVPQVLEPRLFRRYLKQPE